MTTHPTREQIADAILSADNSHWVDPDEEANASARRWSLDLADAVLALFRPGTPEQATSEDEHDCAATREVHRLHSWDGLMELLDEHWPADIIPTLPDREGREPGPRIVSLIRTVDHLRAQATRPPATPAEMDAIHALQADIRADLAARPDVTPPAGRCPHHALTYCTDCGYIPPSEVLTLRAGIEAAAVSLETTAPRRPTTAAYLRGVLTGARPDVTPTGTVGDRGGCDHRPLLGPGDRYLAPCDERPDVTPNPTVSDDEHGHTFRFTVTSRGSFTTHDDPDYHDADWWSEPVTLDVRAWSLNEALVKAADFPLHAWTEHPTPVPDPTFDAPITVGGVPAGERKDGASPETAQEGPGRAPRSAEPPAAGLPGHQGGSQGPLGGSAT